MTSSLVISVGLTVYQLATNETLKLKPYLLALVGVGLPVAVFLAWAEEYRGRGKAQQELGRPPDFSAVLDTQLRLSNTTAAHESQLLQLHGEDDAIRADVDQSKKAMQALIDANAVLSLRVTELSEDLTSLIGSNLKTAKGSLELHRTLRNRVVLLVAELRDIYGRIKITEAGRPQPPIAPPGRHVPSQTLSQHTRDVQDFYGRQTWKQVWDIYYGDFDGRVRAIISELRQANVASERLIAFPENIGPNELQHSLPFSIGKELIPELESAADALTRSPSA